MRLTRVVVEAEGRAFRLSLHERFTVVAGLEPPARRGLARALISALGTGREGLHLEVATEGGRHLAVFRPTGGPARVVDVDRAEDVTAAFVGADGRPELLTACGVVAGEAPARVLLGPSDLETSSSVERRVLALARIDQGRLWELATKVAEREQRLAELTGDDDPLDPGLLAEIERRHRDFEAAQADHERAQRVWLLLGANAGLLAAPMAVLAGWAVAAPLLVLAALMTAWSAHQWRLVEAARRAERQALEQAGAGSYLAFQLSRLDRTLHSEGHRRRAADALAAHRAAGAEWGLLAGDVPVAWAIEHRDRIETAARGLRESADRHNPMALTLSAAEEEAADRLGRLRSRLGHDAEAARGGESLPLVCDDPLVDLAPEGKPPVLEVLVEASSHRQVVLLTGDPDVASWARLEALTGEVGLVEAAPVP